MASPRYQPLLITLGVKVEYLLEVREGFKVYLSRLALVGRNTEAFFVFRHIFVALVCHGHARLPQAARRGETNFEGMLLGMGCDAVIVVQVTPPG